MGNTRNAAVDMVVGGIAGAVATWAMGRTTALLYARESKAAREREDAARGGKTAYGVAAEKTAAVVGRELTEEERARAGSAIHWGLGVSTGALYGALRPHLPDTAARGALFGTAFWLLMDEAATPALGLTPGPGAFPWQTHARGLAGHLVYGVVAETVLDAADRLA